MAPRSMADKEKPTKSTRRRKVTCNAQNSKLTRKRKHNRQPTTSVANGEIEIINISDSDVAESNVDGVCENVN